MKNSIKIYDKICHLLDQVVDNFPKEDRKKIIEDVLFDSKSLEFSYSGLLNDPGDLPKIDPMELYLNCIVHDYNNSKDYIGITFTSMKTGKELLNKGFDIRYIYNNIRKYMSNGNKYNLIF